MIEEQKRKRALEGNLESIEEICSSTWESLYRFVYFKVQNRQEAEDITQETYVKAFSHLQRSNMKIDKYSSFLKTISLNILRDRWRTSKRHGINVDFESINPEEAAVEDIAEASTQRAFIEDALSSLNEEQRSVVELRIIKGHSAAETARIMNKKEGTIRVIQYRALQALGEILKNNDLLTEE